MNPHPNKPTASRLTFQPTTSQISLEPILSGLCQSERQAYQIILEFMEPEEESGLDKMTFLMAVETLSDAVHAQANGSMNDYYPKTLLAKKIERLLLEESTEVLDSSIRQQCMLCIVALSQVNPPFHLCQKLDLVNSVIARVFPLPLIMPSLDRKDNASLYLQTTQALDDMLQALVMDNRHPNMLILQNFLEIILPWITLSDKVHEQKRALGTISRLLRFICNFPEVTDMMSFSINGKLMGILGLFCMDINQETSIEASEALHYVFKILVLQRSVRQKTETILRDLQKNFRGNWIASMQSITLFFRKYLTPTERADMIMVAMEAIASGELLDIIAASKMLKMILKHTVPEIAKVSEIIQYIFCHINRITEPTAQSTVRKIFLLLAQAYTEEVILTLFQIEDQSHTGVDKPWEILASFPKGYQLVMEYLLKRLIPLQEAPDQEPSCHRPGISLLIATRAIYKLLLVPSQRLETQTFFASLFTALLFQISFLVVDGSVETQSQQHVTEWVNPVSSTLETLKILMRSSGYMEYIAHIQQLGGWELLVNPERHYEGVTLLARSLVIKNCWHNRPIFSILIKTLKDPDCANYLSALAFLTELLHCPDVAGIVDDKATNILAKWFKREEPVTLKLLLQMAVVFTKHTNTVRHLHILQPHILSCCYSFSTDVVTETFITLKRLLEGLTWQQSSSFFIQLSFTLVPFFEEESDDLRLMAFQIYRSLLAKVKRRALVFPLKHQILNLIVLLVLHLQDVNAQVVESCRLTLRSTATILGWSKLKTVFTGSDVFTILRALLKQELNRALWFLKQSVALFKSPQAPIRQVAIWFTGQIIQALDVTEMENIEEACTALRHMQRDPDPMVSCLAVQTLYILAVKEKQLLTKTMSSCFCMRRHRRRNL
uniref:Maestro heat-like repeat family member 3 n=1 Tax=Jaculus jaculus TaxID=51337 RepID=A0A8C5LEL4_JACJA